MFSNLLKDIKNIVYCIWENLEYKKLKVTFINRYKVYLKMLHQSTLLLENSQQLAGRRFCKVLFFYL